MADVWMGMAQHCEYRQILNISHHFNIKNSYSSLLSDNVLLISSISFLKNNINT